MKNGFTQGVRATLPVSASVAAYGSVLGVLAAHKGVAWGTLMAMNVFIFAGSSQFVMVDMWNHPLPLFEMALAVMVMNLRYLLAGASLEPLLGKVPLWRRLLAVHVVTDESWAVTMAASRRGEASVSYLVGAGLCVLATWCLGTMAGKAFGSVVAHPEAFAFDFAFTAVFIALAISMWRGNADIAPWAVAIIVSVGCAEFMPDSKWYIVIGAVAGALVSCCMPEKADAAAQAKETAKPQPQEEAHVVE